MRITTQLWSLSFIETLFSVLAKENMFVSELLMNEMSIFYTVHEDSSDGQVTFYQAIPSVYVIFINKQTVGLALGVQ